MPKHKGEDYKVSAVKYYLKIGNQIKTCKIFECAPRSLMRWVKKYEETEAVKRKYRKYIAYKIKKEHIAFMKEEIYKNKTITMEDLTLKLNEKFNTTLSRAHIADVVRDINITLKETRVRHEPIIRYNKPIDIKKQIAEFYETIKKYKLEDIICIDETSLNSFEIRKHCYNDVGRRCVIKTDDQEVFKKFTGIFAITTEGCIQYDIYEKGGIDSLRLVAFLEKILTDGVKNKVVILDNASSHRNQSVKDFVMKHNILLYSIPYQHFSNAIENFFSVLKSKLRKKKTVGYTKLKKNVSDVLEIIPTETYRKIFEGSYNRGNFVYKPKSSTKMKKTKFYKEK